MMTVNGVSKEYGARPVLRGVSFSVKDGQKVALVGPNGVGKSTLLRLVAGVEVPDVGEVNVQDPRGVAYLPQEIKLDQLQLTVLDYLRERAGLAELETDLAKLESDLGSEQALERYADLQQVYTHRGGYVFAGNAKRILAGLGLKTDGSESLNQLSGGQRSKVMLASVLLTESALILLDEPTNNLDLKAIEWLESFISHSPAAFLIVSHDRALLEQVTEKVVEIEWYERTAAEFTGTYQEYLKHRQHLVAQREREYVDRLEEAERLKRSAQQVRQWSDAGRYQTKSDNDKLGRGHLRDRSSRLGKRARLTDKRLEELPEIDRIKQRDPLIIPLQVASGGGVLVTANNVVAGYNEGFATAPFSLCLPMGERLGVLGENGSGKSTVVRTLTGEQKPLSGQLTINSKTVMGVLAQGHENMPREQKAIDHFIREVGGQKQDAYSILARFHLLPEDTDKYVGVLSPGERARLQLATFAARGVNLLVLDEPTNHLDIDALDALVAVLNRYQGAVLFVSHDRYFLEQMTGATIYTMEHGQLRQKG